MQVRTGRTKDDIAAAIQIDLSVTGTHERASYIEAVAERGGLRLALDQGRIVGFCCLDDHCFFEKAFVSLLIVDQGSRRRGVGQALLETTASERPETWTSTNRSNVEMRGLLAKTGWTFCGEVEGLDAGDPELFFKTRLNPVIWAPAAIRQAMLPRLCRGRSCHLTKASPVSSKPSR